MNKSCISRRRKFQAQALFLPLTTIQHNVLHNKYKQQAFTIIEVMIVIALITTLTVWMGPSLSAFVDKNKLSSEINLLNTHLQLAKSTAATQFVYVVFCPSQNRKTCSNNWQDPIMTFIDKNHNNTVDAADEILAIHQIKPTMQLDVNRELITFAPINTATTTAVTLNLCINDKLKKALVISNVGRIRLEADLDKIVCEQW